MPSFTDINVEIVLNFMVWTEVLIIISLASVVSSELKLKFNKWKGWTVQIQPWCLVIQ